MSTRELFKLHTAKLGYGRSRNHKNPKNNVFHLNISIIVKHVNHICTRDHFTVRETPIWDPESIDSLRIPGLDDKE